MSPIYAFVLLLLHFGSELCSAIETITSTQFLRDPDSIVSNNSIFTLGFFSPPNSTNRYVGIWYNHPSIMEVIWVANRNNPLTDSSGILKISDDGNLQVSNAKNQILWSSNNSNPTTHFSVAQLQNSGNLVLQENSTVIWQSAQHPTDSFLPNTRLTIGKNTDLRHVLQSWKSPSDPSNGRFSVGTDYSGLFQIIIFDGDHPHWRSGPWNGNIFIGTRYHNTGYGNVFINSGSFTQEVDGDGGTSLVFTGANESLLLHYELSYEGIIAQKWWDDGNKKWGITWKAPETVCDIYGTCGEFGSCNPEASPMCSCLKGFEPKNEEEWKRGNWTSGCIRKKQLQCGAQGGNEDGFLRLQKLKVPESAEWTLGLNIDQCRSKCFNNCSCLAYAYDTGIACMTWSRRLFDIAVLSPGGVDLYLRLAQSELGNRKTKLKAIIAVAVILGLAAVAAIILSLWKWRARPKRRLPPNRHTKSQFPSGNEIKTKEAIRNQHLSEQKTKVISEDLQLLTFEKLAKATDNFHESNMLGTGGFGPVYKGKLEDGQAIAVKRLSRASGQGIEEFMNEVAVISKLQHRNLVKLQGCCAEGEEKMLIYEYMPNKSLDFFLFDPEKRETLDWEKRFNIIEGICRGLVYLHRDSRLRIIHRDLKASNILLDQDLIPKISDFGLARIFGGNEDQANTQRVVGTYGYMSPEYAMEGQFSEKSDVFSFGVLLLEIVSGKKNSSFWHQEESLSLLGYTWKLWNEDNIASLIDPSISDTRFQGEIVRCIHVGLLCAQEFARDRPSISIVMSMLVSEIVDLPNPKQPGFVQRQLYSSEMGSSSISDQNFSTNFVTITSFTAR